MLSRNRAGISRVKLLVLVAAGALAVIGGATAAYYFSFRSLIREGALDTLGQLNFSRDFTSSAKGGSRSAAGVNAESSSAPSSGTATAKLHIVEFVDYSCPFSKEENALIREFAASNPSLVYFQVRQYPLDELHPTAKKAAAAALCVGEQGKFWAMNDSLFDGQPADGNWTDETLRALAVRVGADGAKYDACVKSGRQSGTVAADLSAGAAAGVSGTPTFIVNGTKIDGAVPADVWQRIGKLAQGQ